MQVHGAQRDRHTAGLYVSTDKTDPLGRLEHAFRLAQEAHDAERKIRDAVKAGLLRKASPTEMVTTALEAGVITQEEAALMHAAEEARNDAIQVDSFTTEEYMRRTLVPEAGDGAAAEAEAVAS